MASSNIEWTEMTWNPTTGCTKISAGCKFCYAETMSKRLHAMGVEKYKYVFKLRLHKEELGKPYHWKKPRIVFVNSMSDLFHKDVPFSFIEEIFKVMNENLQHTFQVLTKRPETVLKYSDQLNWTNNIWLGTSVEDERVIERIDYLRRTGAQTKFLSLEPLIGPLPSLNLKNIDWVIVGGESGHNARPIKKEWVVEIKLKSDEAKVPFFFKQWGKKQFNPVQNDPTIETTDPSHAKGGCSLNGRVYRKMPRR